ncbi:hypothetical protein SODALDRAFT_327558 [Sodiomyces alkalinus F11]|uniref:BTB domain-containing protein n=1 Tax=Sodiomyces alkalinus (strain CBS 110278 / VKM F-3762 / F11) TaxID=1314773 RepID=A0A3N2Q9B5_SODAK|nr:hypothetical protein SODALDRAFT_327558 [Sodiomyces alkalinus F11]ROT43363.1 hypothetical protein SODALDRAFT_327558 [Sodiomyces alkalinus F11]
MVSQPDTSTSLTRRGPSSVISRASLSRSKRYNRSHVGSTNQASQNEFPFFCHSGDVEIVVKAANHENRYLLHRHILTRCSGFFEASTSQEWSRALPLPEAASSAVQQQQSSLSGYGTESVVSHSTSSSPPRQRWRYELDPGAGAGDIPMLVQRSYPSNQRELADATPSLFGQGGHMNHITASMPGSIPRLPDHSRSSSVTSSRGFFRSAVNLNLVPNAPPTNPPRSQADIDLLRDYDNLFRIFYNYPPILDGINIADAYVQCKSLLALSDQYDALAVVGPRVDHHLLQFQSRLWRQIAKYPISYLRLGYLARSKVIFQEALIHVVGQWPSGERSLRAALPDVVLDIIEDKVDELEEIASRVEGRLFRLGLTTSRGERVTPATSYLDWLALSLFRQWLADNISPPVVDHRSRDRDRDRDSRNRQHPGAQVQAPLPPASPTLADIGRAYRILGVSPPSAYLGHDECKRFLKLTPELYSRENLRRFEKRIDELKAMARDIVRPLMGSGLALDMDAKMADAVGYLTCTTVGDQGLPWHLE